MAYVNGRIQVEDNFEQIQLIFKSRIDVRREVGSKKSKFLVEENNHG